LRWLRASLSGRVHRKTFKKKKKKKKTKPLSDKTTSGLCIAADAMWSVPPYRRCYTKTLEVRVDHCSG
jgi:hypothetical protein